MDDKLSRREVLVSLATGSVFAGAASSSVPSEALAASANDVKPFDIHQHLESADSSYSDFESSAAIIAKDFDVRARIMDENGIEKSVMLAGTQYRKTNGIENTKKVNDMVAEYVAKHSDRFPLGVGTVEITHGDASLKELDRIAGELKLRGVVWHHAHSGIQVNHAFMRPVLKRMEELKLVPFIHVYRKPYESLWMVEELAEEFPNTTFVALSGLATIEDHDQAIHIAKRQKNIVFDTGPVIWVREKGVEAFVKRIGSHRLLFGSDLYAMQPSYRRATTTLDVIKNSLITPEEKADILRGNVMRLFNIAERSRE